MSQNQNARDCRSARSFLFVPATRTERIEKARASGAEIVIVDLEDAVSVADKGTARAGLLEWLNSAEAQAVVVRINGTGTPWHTDDVALCRHPQVSAVMLPKAEDAQALETVARSSTKLVLPIIESALSLQNLNAIARAQGCARLVFGKLDLAVDLDLQAGAPDAEEAVFAPYRAMLVLASRLAGLSSPVEGVHTALDDHEGLAAYARRARRDGFGSMLLIHPKQVTPVMSALQPTEKELDWARRVVAAADASNGAACSIDGQMVDMPVILRAKRMLAA